MPSLFTIAFGITLLLGLSGSLSAQTFDPQSLVGEWSGTWQNLGPDAATARGQYRLTIKKVEDTRVFCRLYFTNPRGNFERDIVATLDGNRLRWGGPRPTEFTVEGKVMRGAGGGDAGSFEINLKKQ